MRLSLALLLSVLGLSFFGCDVTESDPLLPASAVFRLTETSGGEGVLVSVQGESDLRAPTRVESDTLVLVRGRQYTGRVDFFNAAGDNITFALVENADIIEVTYDASGVAPFRFTRTDTEDNYDADLDGIDLPVGLQFEIQVPQNVPPLTRGELAVQVLEYAPREKAVAGEAELWSNFTLPLIVSRPGPRFPTAIDRVTGIRLRFTTPDGLDTLRAARGFSNPSGLENGLAVQPDDRFGIPAPGLLVRVYESTLQLDGVLVGDNRERGITSLVRDEGVWYQVEYEVLGAPFFDGRITVADQDVEGFPLGLNFQFAIGGLGLQRNFDLRIQVHRYNAAADKVGGGTGAPRTLVDVTLPMVASP